MKKEQSKQAKTWLAVGEIARYCAVSRATVRRWIKRQELPGIRLAGGHYRVRVADFKDFLRRNDMSISDEFVNSQKEDS